MKVISTERVPIKMWTDDIEDSALEQAKHLANLPFVYKWVSIMPDVHTGYGIPIGGVLATKDVIIPNAVGSDIGCGMGAVKTSLTNISIDSLKKVMGLIRKAVPVGFKHQSKKQDEDFLPELTFLLHEMEGKRCIVLEQYENARSQIGTMGGGNHFLEIQKGSDGHIWIMVHSGSRNLGYQVAKYYNEQAKILNQKWFSQVPKEWDLAFLPIDSDNAQSYLAEMNYCIDFALANRRMILEKVMDILQEEFVCKECNGLGRVIVGENFVTADMATDAGDKNYEGYHYSYDYENCPSCEGSGGIYFDSIINIAHNYVALESHYGENVWVHRKGATLARKGTIGIIPGSQGTKSYIVEGLGNPESFNSCSHGTGRRMSRTRARETLDMNTEIEALEAKGILHSIRGKKDLDEAPGSYKDINTVMKNQKDLVKPLVELTPLGVIKG